MEKKKRAAMCLERARQLRRQGDVSQAVEACKQALAFAPSDAAIHRHLALN